MSALIKGMMSFHQSPPEDQATKWMIKCSSANVTSVPKIILILTLNRSTFRLFTTESVLISHMILSSFAYFKETTLTNEGN